MANTEPKYSLLGAPRLKPIGAQKVFSINSPIASSSMLGVVISMVVVAVPVGPVNSTSKKLWVTVKRRKNCYSIVPNRSPGHFHYFSTIFLPAHPY